MHSQRTIPDNISVVSITSQECSTYLLRIGVGPDITGISTSGTLVEDSDNILATQKATKNYADVHINNTTTAHFGQALSATSDPVFRRLTISKGVVKGLSISIGQWVQLFNVFTYTASEVRTHFKVLGTNPTTGYFEKEFEFTMQPNNGAKTINHYDLAQATTDNPRIIVMNSGGGSASNAIFLWLLTNSDCSLLILQEPTSAEVNPVNRGTGATPSGFGTWSFIYDTADTVNYPTSLHSSFATSKGMTSVAQTHLNLILKDQAPPSKNVFVNAHDMIYCLRDLAMIIRTDATTNVPILPGDGVIVPYDTIVYQSGIYGAYDIDYISPGIVKFNTKGMYMIVVANSAYNVISAARDTETWFETSPDNITWTPLQTGRRNTNSGGWVSRCGTGSLPVANPPLYFRFKVVALNGAAGNLQIAPPPQIALATLGNLDGFASQMNIHLIGLIPAAMTQW